MAKYDYDLFVIGAELATAPGKEDKLRMRLLEEADVSRLERADSAHEQKGNTSHR